MKTSAIIIVALVLNTTLLFAEPLAALIQGINPWFFGILEGVLLGGYYLNKQLKDLNRAMNLNLGDLNLFVIKDPKK